MMLLPASQPSIRATSASDSPQSNRAAFSAWRAEWTLFGSGTKPFCRLQRSSTCSGSGRRRSSGAQQLCQFPTQPNPTQQPRCTWKPGKSQPHNDSCGASTGCCCWQRPSCLHAHGCSVRAWCAVRTCAGVLPTLSASLTRSGSDSLVPWARGQYACRGPSTGVRV